MQVAAWACTLLASIEGRGQGTAFTYQGTLSGPPVTNNLYDLRFTIYDSLAAVTNIVAGPLTNTFAFTGNLGTFTTALDFGQGVFDGNARWLEIAVRTNGGSSFTPLSPRQPLTATPYAILAGDVTSLNVARLNLSGTNSRATGIPQIVNGFVVGVTVTSGGSGYITPPAVTLTNTGSGTGAVIAATISGGHVASLTVYDAGFGYSPGTALLIGDPPNNAYQVFAGANYFSGINMMNNPANSFAGSFNGNGAGLTNVTGVMPWQTVAGTSVQAAPNTGYLLTNAQSATLTLPSSPNLGDLVRVSGVGAGGWRIAQNLGQSILTDALLRPSFKAVASSSDGAKLAAGARSGRIYTSKDSGATLTPTPSPSGSWSALASSSDGSRLVAVTMGDTNNGPGAMYISTNAGASWSATSVPNNNWFCVASSSDGSRLVAVPAAFTNGIYISTNAGASWAASSGPGSGWRWVASSSDGTKLAVVSTYSIYTSTNAGATWNTTSAPNANWTSIASSSDGTKLVATTTADTNSGPGTIYTSNDTGATWHATTAPNRTWASTASSSDGSKLVAVVGGDSDGLIYTSSDSGATWTPISGPTGNWSSVACSSDGTKIVAVGDSIYSSQFNPQLTTSIGPSGYLVGAQSAAIELQYVGNGQFRPLSYVGSISDH
jgi:hypothetical protein